MNARHIQTYYNGIKYRSRTEARWALFFDKMGWTPDYEMEGFDVGGEWYLPDFYVPEINSFCEVKGRELNYDERRKARKLATQTQIKVITLINTPSPVTVKNEIFIPPRTQEEWDKDLTGRAPRYWGWFKGNFTSNSDGEVFFECLTKGCVYLGQSSNSIIDAMNAARNERFGVHA